MVDTVILPPSVHVLFEAVAVTRRGQTLQFRLSFPTIILLITILQPRESVIVTP